jgi:hypothetical protein
MSDDPRVLAAVAYASSPEGSPERKQAFERFAGHFRGPDGVLRTKDLEGWLNARAPKVQPPAPGRVSDDAFAKMPARERLDYVRRFDQSKMPAWRDPRQG